MNKFMFAVGVASATVLLTSAAVSAEAAPRNKVNCVVNQPISAQALNAPNDGYWSFEVFNGVPNVTYRVKVNWAGDPSNNAHSNTYITTDADGYGIKAHQRYWSTDGFLPGYRESFDGSDPMSGWISVPGDFSVQVGPKDISGNRVGKANCSGVVTE